MCNLNHFVDIRTNFRNLSWQLYADYLLGLGEVTSLAHYEKEVIGSFIDFYVRLGQVGPNHFMLVEELLLQVDQRLLRETLITPNRIFELLQTNFGCSFLMIPPGPIATLVEERLEIETPTSRFLAVTEMEKTFGNQSTNFRVIKNFAREYNLNLYLRGLGFSVLT